MLAASLALPGYLSVRAGELLFARSAKVRSAGGEGEHRNVLIARAVGNWMARWRIPVLDLPSTKYWGI